jgi:hypothetical protein
VTSTNTLEHVPEPEIRAILRELRRVLAADGICSFAVDYHDHCADADPSLHVHDYVRLFAEAGFEVQVTDVHRVPLPAGLVPAARFGRSAPDDLAAVYGWFVLRRPAPEPPDP